MGKWMRFKRGFLTGLGFIYTEPELVDVLVDENQLYAGLLSPGRHKPQFGKDKVSSIRVAPRGIGGGFIGKSLDGFNFRVSGKVGFTFNPLDISEPPVQEKFIYRCLEKAEWPENIVKMLTQDAIKKVLGAYHAKDLIGGGVFSNFERDVRHRLHNSLFAGFELLRVQIDELAPPLELTEAMETGRKVSMVAEESLAHLSAPDLASLLQVARVKSMLDGLTDTSIHHIEYGESAKPDKTITVLPPNGGRSRRPRLHPRNNQSQEFIEN